MDRIGERVRAYAGDAGMDAETATAPAHCRIDGVIEPVDSYPAIRGNASGPATAASSYRCAQ